MRHFLRFFTTPWFLAAIFIAPIVLLDPLPTKPYTLELVKKVYKPAQLEYPKVTLNRTYLYCDWNGDGLTDRVFIQLVTFKDKKEHSIYIEPQTSWGAVGSTWWHHTDLAVLPYLQCGDIDNDSMPELILAIPDTGLRLYVWHVNKGNPRENSYALRLPPAPPGIRGKQATGATSICVADVFGDDKKEVIVGINSDFALMRGFIAWNPIDSVYYFSPTHLSRISWKSPIVADIDNDPKMELIPFAYASGNFCLDTLYAFTDCAVYTFVLEDTLRLRFPPDTFGFYTSNLMAYPWFRQSDTLLIFLHVYRGRYYEKYPNLLCIKNRDGITLWQDTLPAKHSFLLLPANHFQAFYLIDHLGNLYEIISEDASFAIQYRKSLQRSSEVVKDVHIAFSPRWEWQDLDNDGKWEYIFITKEKLQILSSDCSYISEYVFEEPEKNLYGNGGSPWMKNRVIPYETGKDRQFIIMGEKYHYFFKYYYNVWYPFRWVVYGSGYGFFVLLLWVFQRVRLAQERRRRRILEQIVMERTAELRQANEELKQLNEELKQVNEELSEANAVLDKQLHTIRESVRYAGTIQRSLIPDRAVLRAFAPEVLLHYRQQSELGGDFWWYAEVDGAHYLLAGDCTGHGVPAALLVTATIQMAREALIMYQLQDMEAVLKFLTQRLKTTFAAQELIADFEGMLLKRKNHLIQVTLKRWRMVLLCKDTLSLQSYNNLRIEQRQGFYVLSNEDNHRLANFSIAIPTLKALFCFSDGIPTQLGGSKQRVFGMKRTLKLLQIAYERRSEAVIDHYLRQWQGNMKQTDDQLLIGLIWE